MYVLVGLLSTAVACFASCPSIQVVIVLRCQQSQLGAGYRCDCMPVSFVCLCLFQFSTEQYALPVLPVLAVAALWCGTTCLSRLYLGVHTILDIVCGILYALAIYAAFSPLTARYDHYQQTHPLAPLVLMATSLALCTICYPSRDKNSAQGDAVQITSVLVGVGVGAWLNYQLGLSVETPVPTGLPIHMPTLHWLGVSVLQFVFGVVVVFALKTVVKFASVRFFSAFFGLDRVDAQHPNVMIGYKYTTYLTLGLIISFLNPLLFTPPGDAGSVDDIDLYSGGLNEAPVSGGAVGETYACLLAQLAEIKKMTLSRVLCNAFNNQLGNVQPNAFLDTDEAG
ncbi:hypothetical protein BaRGS_00015510, partial [Batillaria attramentaria]